MILVTGAAGKTGRAIIRELAARGADVRAFVRRPSQRQEVITLGAKEAVSGDLGQLLDIKQAFEGVEAIYHICPNVDPREEAYAARLIELASTAGLGQFGYHSVLHPQTESMAHHWRKLRVEEALFESGLPFTIIQPCAYMQNLLAQKDAILASGLIRVPYSVEARLSLVDLQDVAKVVATVLMEPGHTGAIYELAGPEPVSHRQIAAVISDALERRVVAERLDIDAWTKDALGNGLGDYQIRTLRSMFDYYDQYGFIGNSNVLTYLLGQEPTTIQGFISRELSR